MAPLRQPAAQTLAISVADSNHSAFGATGNDVGDCWHRSDNQTHRHTHTVCAYRAATLAKPLKMGQEQRNRGWNAGRVDAWE